MPERALVTARSGLRLRASPGDGDVLTVLPRNAEVEVLGRETWLRVRAGDLEGFVRSDWVERSPARDLIAAGRVVNVRAYTNDRFVGEPIRADEGFEAALDRINELADRFGLDVWITSSAREPDAQLVGTVVPPAERSNHLVGHAIDMNLVRGDDFFNSRVLARGNLPNLPSEVQGFIEGIRKDAGLRWGGDFGDPVHVDDDLNHRDPGLWERKFEALFG